MLTEAQTNIIETNTSDEPNKKKAKRTQLKKRDFILPCIVFIGEIDEITNVFVIINDFKYEVLDLIDAVNLCFEYFLCFKIPFANTIFPHIWTFLQQYIYKIENARKYKCSADLSLNFEELDKQENNQT